MEWPLGDRERALGDPALKKPPLAPVLAVLLAWTLLIYLVPLGVGYAVGAVPVRLVSSGILFDQTATTLGGYRMVIWGPVVAGVLLAFIAVRLRPLPFTIALGILGATYAGTLLVFGAALGIGPGATLLVGLELRWVWKICAAAGGTMIGLVGVHYLKARAEDHQLDFMSLRRGILLGGLLVGAALLLLGPGPMLGKVMTGAGSWLGSAVWLLGL